MVRMIHAGASNVGSTVVTIWISSQAATAYVTPTLTTLRRLSSAKNGIATGQSPPAPEPGFYRSTRSGARTFERPVAKRRPRHPRAPRRRSCARGIRRIVSCGLAFATIAGNIG